MPEDAETLLIGEASRLAAGPARAAGVVLREVTGHGDLRRIQAMEEAVWGDDHGWLPGVLADGMADPDDPLAVVIAEAGPDLVCVGWIRFHQGTGFASLWGGSTLPAWRRRGIYRATVAYRARLADARGFRYLQVDASPDSEPVLARLGLLPVATTIPYVWSPPPGPAPN